MSMTRLPVLSAVLAAGLSTAAVAQSADTVVATVNGDDITLGHMAVLYERLPDQYRQMPPEALYDGILEQLIQQTAVGAMLTDLSARGELTLQNEERALRATEVIVGATDAAVTDEALQEAYDRLFADAAGGTEYNANHILVETQEEAQAIKDELDAGAAFEELAMQRSTGPSGPNGGALGWFGEGMMVAPFEEAVVAMQPGEVSAPVQTQFGWHIIKLNETRQAEAPPLDEVRDQLEEEVRAAAVQQLVDNAVAEATIARAEEEIDPAVLTDQSLFSE